MTLIPSRLLNELNRSLNVVAVFFTLEIIVPVDEVRILADIGINATWPANSVILGGLVAKIAFRDFII